MKRARIIFALVLIGIALLVYTQIGKTADATVRIEESEKFTEAELQEAVAAVKKKFLGFRGCELTDIWYDEKESDAMAEDYLTHGGVSGEGVKSENVVVLLSNFKVGSSAGGSFEPNSTHTGWKWILVRDSKEEKWKVEDWGY